MPLAQFPQTVLLYVDPHVPSVVTFAVEVAAAFAVVVTGAIFGSCELTVLLAAAPLAEAEEDDNAALFVEAKEDDDAAVQPF